MVKMISRRKAVRLFFICLSISLICNFPPASTSASLNTAVHELRRFIYESYQRRGIELSRQAELIIRTVILNCWFVSQFIGVSIYLVLEKAIYRQRLFFLLLKNMADSVCIFYRYGKY